MSKQIRILLVGHLSDRVSGSSLSFGMLLDQLQSREDVSVRFVSSARPRQFTSNLLVNLITAFRVVIGVIRQMPHVDVVSFQASSPAMLSFAAVMAILSKLSGKPLLLRVFGGGLDEEYSRLGTVRKWMFRAAANRSDILLLQTRYLVSYFSRFLKCTIEWFPTSRPLPEMRSSITPQRDIAKKFVFMGRISEQKGIELILECAHLLNEGIIIDLFGSLDEQYSSAELDRRGGGRVRYRGSIPMSVVQERLSQYDALLLPTHYPGEGYPGAIVEAYSRGLPVIATRWRAIPEIVTEETGIVIDSHSAQALADAINRLNESPDLYVRLRSGAMAARDLFNSEYWTGRFVEMCAKVYAERSSRKRRRV